MSNVTTIPLGSIEIFRLSGSLWGGETALKAADLDPSVRQALPPKELASLGRKRVYPAGPLENLRAGPQLLHRALDWLPATARSRTTQTAGARRGLSLRSGFWAALTECRKSGQEDSPGRRVGPGWGPWKALRVGRGALCIPFF